MFWRTIGSARAGSGIRTRVSGVEDHYANHYTIPAWWKEIFHLLYRASSRSRGLI